MNWQPTELTQHLPVIRHRISQHSLDNILEPMLLDVNVKPWPRTEAQAFYTCNTMHIVGMESIRCIFAGCKEALGQTGKLCVYGPFAIHGKLKGEGNIQFDQELRASNPNSGIKDLSTLDDMARQMGFSTCRYKPMPANNHFVVWEVS